MAVGPEVRAHFRQRAFLVGQGSLGGKSLFVGCLYHYLSLVDQRRLLDRIAAQLRSARLNRALAEHALVDARAGVIEFLENVRAMYHEDHSAALTRQLFTEEDCIAFVRENAYTLVHSYPFFGEDELIPLDDLLRNFETDIFDDLPAEPSPRDPSQSPGLTGPLVDSSNVVDEDADGSAGEESVASASVPASQEVVAHDTAFPGAEVSQAAEGAEGLVDD